MALYRKYRPATFAELVGQEQVTKPLSAALDAGRINHAYLFSGPRGCGKTSSARIMARSLNCVEGPTSTPCGVCPSCVSLAPGGPGNLDVTELDAASHNGVEDMRELRDRAYYAPAESRYRVFIIDEAHMISNSGANALLKVVEEPPEHLIFIFATTEPEKIIGTIRSRTHHYPFRLLTPPAMKGLLERTVAAEGMHVEDSVYPLVIQAGGGSPRDTLSILDQLLAGAGEQGLTYDLARPLLGVTDLTLLDDTVAALAAGDKAELFRIVDHVIDAGHEPRRFATDLLDRLRDLMVLQAVPSAFSDGLVDAPTDRAEALAGQASQFTGPQLTQYASVVSDGISNLRGATSPRLLLEILCAKLLVTAPPAPGIPGTSAAASIPGAPGSQHTAASSSGAPGSGTDAAAAAAAAAAQIGQRHKAAAQSRAAEPAQPQQKAQPAESAQPQAPQQVQPEPQAPQQTKPESPAPQQAQTEPPAEKPVEQAGDIAAKVRENWSGVRSALSRISRVAAIMAAEARVLGYKDSVLVLGHNTGALASRLNADEHKANISKAIEETVGVSVDVNCVVGTNPKAAGFDPSGQQAAQAQQPQQAQQAQHAPQPQKPTPQQGHSPAHDDVEPDSDQEPESPGPTVDSADTAGWGNPRQIGGNSPATSSVQSQEQELNQPQKQGFNEDLNQGNGQQTKHAAPQADAPEAEAKDWRAMAAQAAEHARLRSQEHASNSFSDGVPLPPEPTDFEPPAPEESPYEQPSPGPAAEPAGQTTTQQATQPNVGAVGNYAAPGNAASGSVPHSLEEQEEEMIEAAQQPGERDRRNALEVAMELLTQELGAKRV